MSDLNLSNRPPHGEIAFLDRFKEPLLSGEKGATIRYEQKGEQGDILEAAWCYLEILQLAMGSLGRAQRHLYDMVAADSPEHFKDVWLECYPDKAWDPDAEVVVHALGLRGKCPSCEHFVPVQQNTTIDPSMYRVDIHTVNGTVGGEPGYGYCPESDSDVNPWDVFR